MAEKRITDVDFINSLDSNESFFVNKNNTIKQINKGNIVFSVANGGTGATTAKDALANLGATSKAYVDEQIQISKEYTESTVYEQVQSAKAKDTTVTLTNDAWVNNIQTVYSGAVTENSIIFISPSASSYVAYCDANIRCVSQSVGSLTFQCEYVPDVNIVVNVVVM